MSDSPSPQSFAALRHPGYRAYFIGSAMAMMADSIEHVISYWIIFQEFHSPALAGFAVIAHWLPFILFSVHAGALADRFDPRRVMQWGMVLFMGVSVGWGLLFLTDSLEMWHAMVLLALHGIAGVLWAPAGQMLIHDIVGPAQLQSGVRLLATSRTLGFLLGPAIGGGMLLALGPDWGIMVNALIYLPLTIWLVNAPYGPRFRKEGDFVPSAAIRGLGDILATVKNAASNPTIISMTLLAGAASLFVGNAHQAQMPEFSQDFGFGGSGLYYSILLAANGAGAVVAGLVLESKGFLEAKPRTAFILVLLWCLAIAGFAGVSSYTLALILLFIAGFLELAYNSMAQTLVQLGAPPEMRGRIIGLYIVSSLGMKTFSGITVGVAGGFIGIHWSLALSALALLTVTAGLMVFAKRAARAS